MEVYRDDRAACLRLGVDAAARLHARVLALAPQSEQQHQQLLDAGHGAILAQAEAGGRLALAQQHHAFFQGARKIADVEPGRGAAAAGIGFTVSARSGGKIQQQRRQALVLGRRVAHGNMLGPALQPALNLRELFLQLLVGVCQHEQQRAHIHFGAAYIHFFNRIRHRRGGFAGRVRSAVELVQGEPVGIGEGVIDAAVIEHVRCQAVQSALTDQRRLAIALVRGRAGQAALIADQQFLPQFRHLSENTAFHLRQRQRFAGQLLDLLRLQEIDRFAQGLQYLEPFGGRQVEAIQFVQLAQQPDLRRRYVDQRQLGQPRSAGGAVGELRVRVGGELRQLEFGHGGHWAGIPLILPPLATTCARRASGRRGRPGVARRAVLRRSRRNRESVCRRQSARSHASAGAPPGCPGWPG